MGAIGFLITKLTKENLGDIEIEFISRSSSPSPAPGSYKIFAETQKKLIEEDIVWNEVKLFFKDLVKSLTDN